MLLNKITICCCGISFLLLGCQQIEPRNKNENEIPMSSTNTDMKNIEIQTQKSAIQIARYKVPTTQPTFLTSTTTGIIQVEDNCLVLSVAGNSKPFLLALPISDDNAQWKLDFKDNILFFDNEKIEIGKKVNVGGGASDFSRLYIKPTGCENYIPWNAFNIRVSP